MPCNPWAIATCSLFLCQQGRSQDGNDAKIGAGHALLHSLLFNLLTKRGGLYAEGTMASVKDNWDLLSFQALLSSCCCCPSPKGSCGRWHTWLGHIIGIVTVTGFIRRAPVFSSNHVLAVLEFKFYESFTGVPNTCLMVPLL